MTYPNPDKFDIDIEIEKFFQDSSLIPNEKPKAVILCGGICVGKTTVRKSKFASGYVVIDAAEIFLNLTGSNEPRFPGPLAKTIWKIGSGVFLKAVNCRFNIVTEILGAEAETIEAIIDTFCRFDYTAEILFVDSGFDESVDRKLRRGDDNLSSYFTEGFHMAWIRGMQAPKWVSGDSDKV